MPNGGGCGSARIRGGMKHECLMVGATEALDHDGQ